MSGRAYPRRAVEHRLHAVEQPLEAGVEGVRGAASGRPRRRPRRGRSASSRSSPRSRWGATGGSHPPDRGSVPAMELPRPAVLVALLTPYERGGGGVDEGAMRAHVDWLVEAGVDGLMPCGTTGEGPLLSDD